MVKYICDCCGKEVEKLNDVALYGNDGEYYTDVQLCKECNHILLEERHKARVLADEKFYKNMVNYEITQK